MNGLILNTFRSQTKIYSTIRKKTGIPVLIGMKNWELIKSYYRILMKYVSALIPTKKIKNMLLFYDKDEFLEINFNRNLKYEFGSLIL